MPKMKTHRGAAKRFKVTGRGKIKINHAYKSHKLEKKTSRRKRNLRQAGLASPADVKRIKRMLGM